MTTGYNKGPAACKARNRTVVNPAGGLGGKAMPARGERHCVLEATSGIEPEYTVLQTVA